MSAVTGAVTMPDEIDPPNTETVHHKLCSAMTPGIGLAIADKAILFT
jgi:hypothetical protein